jgi:hypothetical protein
MLRAGLLVAALALSTAAFAQQVEDIPVPDQGSDPQVWFDTYIEADGWTILGADGVAIALGSPEGVERFQDGTLRATVRHEYYQAREFGGQQMRSLVQTRIVDCARSANRIVSMTIFERSNMQGASATRQNESAAWDTPRDDSLYRTAMERICAAPVEGARLN